MKWFLEIELLDERDVLLGLWGKICKEKPSKLTFSSFLSPEALEIHGSFTWLGQTQYKLQLKSEEIHTLQLKACFVHTGVYNLGTPRVFAKLSDQVTVFETSQQNSMPALIIINNVWHLANPQESVLFYRMGFTAVFEIPNLFWRLVSDHCKILWTCQLVDNAKHVGLRILIFLFCISLNLVIIYMLIIQTFNISVYLIKPYLEKQCLSLLLQLSMVCDY